MRNALPRLLAASVMLAVSAQALAAAPAVASAQAQVLVRSTVSWNGKP